MRYTINMSINSSIQKFKKQLQQENIQGLVVDIDETLSQTKEYWIERMQIEFGNPEKLSVEEIIIKYRYTQHVPYWQTEEVHTWIDIQIHSNEIQELLPLIPESNTILQKIHRQIPVVAYLTSRPQSVIAGTQNWLQKHQFPEAEIIARPPEVSLDEGNTWKASILEYLYPQVLGIIDDNPGLAEALPSTYKGVLYVYKNIGIERDDIRIVQCATWQDILNAITK